MIPVARNADRKLDFAGLCNDILTKSTESVRDKRTLAHAILLFTDRDASLAEMLNNPHQYRALDRRSGRYLNIYHANASLVQQNQETAADEPRMMRFMMSLPVNIYSDEPTYSSIIERFREEHEISADINNPILLFFRSR